MSRAERLLNTIGLLSGIIGVVILFQYGPPQPNLDTGVSLIVSGATPIDKSGKTAAQHDAEVNELRNTYDTMSKIGLALVAVGFVFQLAALWLPRQSSRDPTHLGGALREPMPSEPAPSQTQPKKTDNSAP